MDSIRIISSQIKVTGCNLRVVASFKYRITFDVVLVFIKISTPMRVKTKPVTTLTIKLDWLMNILCIIISDKTKKDAALMYPIKA